MIRMKLWVGVVSVFTFMLLVIYLHSTSLLNPPDISVGDGGSMLPYSTPLQVGETEEISQVVPVKPVTSQHNIHVRQRQYARRGHVQSICEDNGLGDPVTKPEHIEPSDFSRVFVDEKYKILYCEVPKVACTNWKRILLILTGKMNTSDPEQLRAELVHTTYQDKYLRTLDTYKPRQILNRIRHYYKFMFVRSPLERLVSAYRNKFRMSYNKRYQLRYGKKIIKRYRKNATDHALEFGDDVNFEEFIKFLLDIKAKQTFDVHWRPYYQICHPCTVQYDFIGKYETLQEDVDFILDELGVKHLINFPQRPNVKSPKTAEVLNSVFAKISSEQLHNLWKLYSVDFSMFDYPYPDFDDR